MWKFQTNRSGILQKNSSTLTSHKYKTHSPANAYSSLYNVQTLYSLEKVKHMIVVVLKPDQNCMNSIVVTNWNLAILNKLYFETPYSIAWFGLS